MYYYYVLWVYNIHGQGERELKALSAGRPQFRFVSLFAGRLKRFDTRELGSVEWALNSAAHNTHDDPASNVPTASILY